MTTPYSEGGRAHTANQRRLEEYKYKFAAETAYGQRLLDLFAQAGAGVWRVERDTASGTPRWWINITLPSALRDMFDLHLEILVLYAEHNKIEPRTLSALQQRMRRDHRLEPGVALIASQDRMLSRTAQRRRGELSLVDITLDDLEADNRDLRSRIASVLTAVDHFDVTNPIREPSAFFGRESEIDQLSQALNRGQSVGIFGLRKAGKTSLMNSLQRIRQEAGRPVVKIDLSEASTADHFKLMLLERTWEAVHAQKLEETRQTGQADKMPKLRLLNAQGKMKSDFGNISLHWTEDLRTLIAATQMKVELFIDEIDQAYPVRSALGDEAKGLFQALVQLRGLVQAAADTDQGIVLLGAGVDPSIFETPLLNGADNLIYKLVRLIWLAPMDREDMAEMVRALGRRMGVRVRDHEVINRLYVEFGGHPLLTRKACSLATQGRLAAELPFHITLERLEKALEKRGFASMMVQARDVLNSFEQWFPDEAQILRLIWATTKEDRELGEAFADELPDGLIHAQAYGLMFADRTPRMRAMLTALTGEDQ